MRDEAQEMKLGIHRNLVCPAVVGPVLTTAFDVGVVVALLGVSDLSPKGHPAMGRILWSFEPVWLGDATGRGAEPSTQRSVPSRCMSDAVSLA